MTTVDKITRAIEVAAIALFRKEQQAIKNTFDARALEMARGDRILELQIKANGPRILPWEEVPAEVQRSYRNTTRHVLEHAIPIIFDKIINGEPDA